MGTRIGPPTREFGALRIIPDAGPVTQPDVKPHHQSRDIIVTDSPVITGRNTTEDAPAPAVEVLGQSGVTTVTRNRTRDNPGRCAFGIDNRAEVRRGGNIHTAIGIDCVRVR